MQDQADQTWPLTVPISAIELWGTIAMRASGTADILVRIWAGSRLVLNENLKQTGAGTQNIQVHVPAMAFQAPAATIRIQIGAAGAGNAWPVDAEIELTGRWQ